MAKAERVAGTARGGREVRIEFEGEPIAAREGEPLVAALLASGVEVFSRAVKYHRARGPYCLSGRCSQCLCRVDGEPNVTACTTPVRAGMKVQRQNAFPSVNHDVFQTIDWMYPRGLDHHALFAGVPVVEKVVAKVAREMAGLGTLPDAARAPEASFAFHETEVLVVGGGSAGLAAARAAAEAGSRVTVVDEQPALGGRIRAHLPVPGGLSDAWAEEQQAAIREKGGHLLPDALAFGLYRERGTLVPIRTAGRRLLLTRPKAVVIATGASEPLPAFANNDLPGIFAGRALARMVTVDGVLPGRSAVVAGEGPEVAALARVLRQAGCEVVAEVGLEGPGPRLVRARGRNAVAGAILTDAKGAERKVRCEMIAIAGQSSALVDLARHAGAHVAFRDGHFLVAVDGEGATGIEGIFACGEVTGPCTAAEAAQQGERAGRAAARHAAGGAR